MAKKNEVVTETLRNIGKGDLADVFDSLDEDSQDKVLELLGRSDGGGDALSNPAPAIEEGPHLQDPKVRDAKREQLANAGISPDDETLTDDMRSILEEEV